METRKRKHLFMTKRKESDYIQPRMSESNVFGRQVQSHQNAEETLNEKISRFDQEEEDQMAEEDKAFNREAYTKLKGELKQRKEAKERLLSQGLPQFKAYLRF